MRAVSQTGNPKRIGRESVRIPSRWLEYAYYFSLVYYVIAPALNLDIPILSGGMILVLSAFCFLQLQSYAKAVYKPIALLLACVASFFFIQVVIHGESAFDGNIRPFIIWILALIIVRSLCLRPRFSLRFPIVLFVVGAATLPFLGVTADNMAHVDLAVQGGLSHPAGFAAWFGFCAVFFAMVGLETKHPHYRIVAWLLGLGCLFTLALSLERGPLIGTAMAITVGFRRLLRRGFAPVLLMIIFLAVVYESGLFEQAISQYTERATEKTGREVLWPEAIERIMQSPFIGVGVSKVLIRLTPVKEVPPHNTFLYFALSSGVVPFVFFVAFWVQAALGSLAQSEKQKEGLFQIPYLIFTFVAVMLGDFWIMEPWALLTVSVCAGSGIFYRTQRRLVMGNPGGRQIARRSGPRSREAACQ